MGQCGCGDFQYDEAFKVGGKVLAVQLYEGCQDCDTPIGVVLHLFKPSEAKRWDIDPAALEPFLEDDYVGYGAEHIPIIHPQDLAKAAKSAEFQAEFGEIDMSEYTSLSNLLDDCGPSLLQIALRITHQRYAGQRKKADG